ncbi:MAG TPA: hypothetical protein VJN96_27085 [Vicinamibacterales bacterium]|nr:hypothetical protein [Vicinamibacterales bacterium]
MTRAFGAAAGTALAFSLVFGASPAAAQTQGPLVLQPIQNPVVFAPDVKITNIVNTTGVFVGGYAGVNLDRTFLLGAAGYWLVEPYNTIHMGYGGFLVGWRVVNNGAFSLAVRDLIGGGTATTYTYAPYAVPGPPVPAPRHGYSPYSPYGPYGYWTGFFVTEPEVRAQIALGSAVSVDAGVGYRVTASGYGYRSNLQLNGVAGSIAVRFNFGY